MNIKLKYVFWNMYFILISHFLFTQPIYRCFLILDCIRLIASWIYRLQSFFSFSSFPWRPQSKVRRWRKKADKWRLTNGASVVWQKSTLNNVNWHLYKGKRETYLSYFGRYAICDAIYTCLGKTVLKMWSQKSTRSTSFVLQICQRLLPLSCLILFFFLFFILFFLNFF